MSEAVHIVDGLIGSIDSTVKGDPSSAPPPLRSVCNFSAGPSALPESVLLEAQRELFDFKGAGLSVMEMSHRSKVFDDIWQEARSDLRELLNIPPNYQIMFLQGGATMQFSAIPLNLNLRNQPDKVADYVVTGVWSSKAAKEAKKYGRVNIAADESESKFTGVTPASEWKLSGDDAAYLYICVNETVHGVLIDDSKLPDVKCPIIADYSSCFMSAPIDISKFGIVYAGAQKNIGPAGVTVVIVRDDLIGKADPLTPMYFDYAKADGGMMNTPPCWSAYVMGLVLKWLKNDVGGLEGMAKINVQKAKELYDAIEGSDGYYIAPVAKDCRSLMNVRFSIKSGADAEKKFLAEAAKGGFQNLKGHRSLGGLRASIYNAQPLANIRKLIAFMADFQKANP
jgi:phosphoserine aminotransferase